MTSTMLLAPAPLAQRLLELCRVSSLTGEERPLADLLHGELDSQGFAVRRYGNSLVAPLFSGTRQEALSSRVQVALVGHLDVVRTEHDGPPRVEGDRLYGPGAADMKSGLALMLDTALDAASLPVDVTLVFYAGEEGPYLDNELEAVLVLDPSLRQVDIAVLLEPSDNKLQLGCGGSIHALVRFRGRTAHSARPWQGENAIVAAAPLLMRLRELEPTTVNVDGLEWREVKSATLARGGRARNIIPDEFEVNVNYRFSPSRSLGEAKAEFETWLLDACQSARLRGGSVDIQFVDVSPAAPPHRNHPLVRALEQAGTACVEPKQAWTDVARFASHGVLAVNFGPGVQAQAHQRNEWTSVSALDAGRKILRQWFLSLKRT